ncbi:hypothetical protein V7S43_010547 [Phytophthora oleae]|uniref:Ankyrin repeat protein n=1 Tax=Phytophthora oleae TaxID=2107226 RepID=A0ABD3FBC8_9STRA
MNESALFKASLHGHVGVVLVLLENGAAVDQKGPNEATALFEACTNGHLDIVVILVEKGASIDVKNSDGVDLVAIARANDHNDIADALLKCSHLCGETSIEVVWTDSDPKFVSAVAGCTC